MSIHATQLEAKVAARNKVNGIALRMFPAMIEALRPFIGKKITIAGNQLSMKLRSALPKSPASPSESWYYSASSYALWVQFKTCEVFPSRWPDTTIASYAEHAICIADLNIGTLDKLPANPPQLRTDYTTGEVESARANLKAAKDALHAAEFALAGFGEYDN